MWHQRFNRHFTKLREHFLCSFIQQFVSSASPWRHFGEYHDVCACFDLNVNNVCVSIHGEADTEQHTLFTFSGYSPKWCQGDTEEMNQPHLTAIYTYFTRWLIHTTSIIQNYMIFAKLYIFYGSKVNLYEWPTPNPAPKSTRHWGLDKSYKIRAIEIDWGRTNSSALATS